MRNDYSQHTFAKLDELVAYFAGGYASAVRDRSDHGAHYRHVYRNCLQEVAQELNARYDVHAEALGEHHARAGVDATRNARRIWEDLFPECAERR